MKPKKRCLEVQLIPDKEKPRYHEWVEFDVFATLDTIAKVELLKRKSTPLERRRRVT
jgi:hypothetical protein